MSTLLPASMTAAYVGSMDRLLIAVKYVGLAAVSLSVARGANAQTAPKPTSLAQIRFQETREKAVEGSGGEAVGAGRAAAAPPPASAVTTVARPPAGVGPL